MFRKYPISCIALISIGLLLVFQSYRSGSWRNNRSIIHDITSYYSYLPAAFIYRDFRFDYRYQLPDNEPVDHVWVNQKGDTVFQKMSLGLAYFYTPTFLLAHAYSLNQKKHYPNGFSKPYQMAMNINTLLFGFLGLFVFCLVCIKLFDDLVAAILVLLVYGGTNLLYYVSIAPGLSHPYSFLLISLLFLLTLYYYEKPKRRILLTMALIVGLLILIRPTNFIPCLFPLLYGLHGKNRTIFIETLKQPFNILLIILFFLIPWIPQFIYWKYASGQFFFYSYDQEGFFFNKSHVFDALFGFRKGWFIYTPLMFVAFIGLFIKSSHRAIQQSLYIILPLFIYLVFSWWCWWYGGSFGSRVMIDLYPFMALGLGLFINNLLKMSLLKRMPFLLSIVFLLVLNFNQIWQYSLGMLHWDSMTKEAYQSIFLKETPPDNFQELLSAPDYKKAMLEGE